LQEGETYKILRESESEIEIWSVCHHAWKDCEAYTGRIISPCISSPIWLGQLLLDGRTFFFGTALLEGLRQAHYYGSDDMIEWLALLGHSLGLASSLMQRIY
jgi:hypothetical protein